MGESLTQRRRVEDDGLRVVNSSEVKNARKGLTVTSKEAPANYVPAAAVIRRGQTLLGITGRKGCVGGWVSQR